mgnify:CR=1 FL=1
MVLHDFRYPNGQQTIETQLSMAKISYKVPVDYRQQFDNFMELGVGGLGKQIQELYQRAFASRGINSFIPSMIFFLIVVLV